MIGFRVSAFFQAYLFLLLGSRCPNTPYLLDRIASSRPNFVFKAEFRLRGRISSSGPNIVFVAEFRLQGRISSSRPNFVFRAEFRLRGRISSSGPNFVFAAEFRLQGRISSSGPNFVFAAEFRFRAEFRLRGRISSSRPNIVFRTDFRLQSRISSSGPNFVFRAEFRLHRAPNRISSSREFRLHGRFSSSNFVFAHNLSFSSLGTISSSKASEFRLQGVYETGTHFPGSMLVLCGQTCVVAFQTKARVQGLFQQPYRGVVMASDAQRDI